MKGGALWIAWKSLRQHALSTWIAAGSIALAGGLLMAVWTLRTEAENTFARSTGGFDAVLGARGSQLQLVLNSIFHLEASPGTIPGNTSMKLKRHPMVGRGIHRAIPIAVGDNYKGYRLVGTVNELFEEHEYAEGRKFEFVGDGKLFGEDQKQAVAGSFAAEKLGLRVGDTFQPYHGLTYVEESQHTDVYTMTGILKSTGTPADRVIWIPLHGIQNMEGHREETRNDISALLIKLKSKKAVAILDPMFNKQGKEYTFASITPVMSRFFQKFGWFEKILELVAYLVGLVAAGSILAILYNSMNEKRREIAILRSLGARRSTLVSMVIFQSTGIALLGVVLSFLFYAVVASVAAGIIRDRTGVVLDLFSYQEVFFWMPVGMVALGILSGLVPSIIAYRTEISKNLAPTS
uniref:ABC-type antimicrobial peptide transport system, permease component n=1 Tax=uncultured verrucomicrobium HF0500_27H16 TaxID=723600 RepID=E7C5J4_9BACT|nr:ABC-type antimicrobial peptide transport system, permease component [uncultured verrucomicrobium HF0500_27H16]